MVFTRKDEIFMGYVSFREGTFFTQHFTGGTSPVSNSPQLWYAPLVMFCTAPPSRTRSCPRCISECISRTLWFTEFIYDTSYSQNSYMICLIHRIHIWYVLFTEFMYDTSFSQNSYTYTVRIYIYIYMIRPIPSYHFSLQNHLHLTTSLNKTS